MFAELRHIEKLVNLVLGKPLAWALYGCWLLIVGLANVAVWARKRLRPANDLQAGRPK